MNGLCECGCGKATTVSTKTENSRGWVKGQPKRFLRGHGHSNPPSQLKHGASHSREYFAYQQAKHRCTNSNNKAWKDYGGRGICFLLISIEAMIAEIGLRPEGANAKGKALYSLDRIDNDGHYEHGNIRWATKSEQIRNRRKREHGNDTEQVRRAQSSRSA